MALIKYFHPREDFFKKNLVFATGKKVKSQVKSFNLKYYIFYHQVSKIKGLEILSLWKRLNSFNLKFLKFLHKMHFSKF